MAPLSPGVRRQPWRAIVIVFVIHGLWSVCAQPARITPEVMASLKLRADTTGNDSARAEATYQFAHALFDSNQPDSAMVAYARTLALCDRCPCDRIKGKTLLDQSQAFYFDGRTEAALDALGQAYALFETLRDTLRMSWCTGNIAVIQTTQGKYDLAIDNFSRTKNILLRLGDTARAAISWLNIGQSLIHTRAYARALPVLDSAIAQFSKDGQRAEELAMCYRSKGAALEKLGRQPEALGLYLTALRLAREIEDQYTIGEIYTSLIDYHIKTRKFNMAMKYINEDLERCTKINYKSGISMSWILLGKWHFEQKHYQKALEAAETGLAIGKEADIAANQQEAHLLLARIHRRMWHPKAARQHEAAANALLHPATEASPQRNPVH